MMILFSPSLSSSPASAHETTPHLGPPSLPPSPSIRLTGEPPEDLGVSLGLPFKLVSPKSPGPAIPKVEMAGRRRRSSEQKGPKTQRGPRLVRGRWAGLLRAPPLDAPPPWDWRCVVPSLCWELSWGQALQNAPTSQEKQAVFRFGAGAGKDTSEVPNPRAREPPIPVLGQEFSWRGEGKWTGREPRRGALCGWRPRLLQADLLWRGWSKQMLISSRRRSAFLSPESKGEERGRQDFLDALGPTSSSTTCPMI